jgi:hypothetical protein
MTSGSLQSAFQLFSSVITFALTLRYWRTFHHIRSMRELGAKDTLANFVVFSIVSVASLCEAVWCLKPLYYNPTSDHFRDALGRLVPTDVPCPSLWKDPLADTLWVF